VQSNLSANEEREIEKYRENMEEFSSSSPSALSLSLSLSIPHLSASPRSTVIILHHPRKYIYISLLKADVE
jgi:hypothetical protein